MKIVYHRGDLDGKASGAVIWKKFCDQVEWQKDFIAAQYGEEFPFERISEGETVIMADFSLQPFDSEMTKLADMCKLVWIDHHSTAIKDYKNSGLRLAGLRKDGEAACSLCWRYFFPRQPVPLALKYLSLYDIWDHSNPNVLPFQYGLRMEYTNLESEIWQKIWVSDPVWISSVINVGKTLLKYEERTNNIYRSAFAFPVTLDGYKCLAINRGLCGSLVFGEEINNYDMVIAFVLHEKGPERSWNVSLYSTQDHVDCGQIAKTHGGGGHKGAAGFTCLELPF